MWLVVGLCTAFSDPAATHEPKDDLASGDKARLIPLPPAPFRLAGG